MAGVFIEPSRRKRLVRVIVWAAIVGLLLGVLGSLALGGSADAHAALRSIAPADGARLSTAPTQVVLTFDEPVSTSFATVTVTDAGGASVSSGPARVKGAVVTQDLTPGLAAGPYAVAYRVVSDDGHPVSERTTFTVLAPAGADAPASGPTETPLASSSPATAAGAPADGSGGSGGSGDSAGDNTAIRLAVAVGVAALALAAGTAIVAATRRRNAS
jgi:copper resistance protein C